MSDYLQRVSRLGPAGRTALRRALDARAETQQVAASDLQLVAYVRLAPDAGVDALDALSARLRADLPDYMVPAHIVSLATIPRTPNGKVDHRALPTPSERTSDLATGLDSFVAPRSDAELALARVWGEVLGINEIGAHDHFFELGGHSLLVNQVVARIRDVFDVELPLRTLFDAPTLAGLALAVEDAVIAELNEASES